MVLSQQGIMNILSSSFSVIHRLLREHLGRGEMTSTLKQTFYRLSWEILSTKFRLRFWNGVILKYTLDDLSGQSFIPVVTSIFISASLHFPPHALIYSRQQSVILTCSSLQERSWTAEQELAKVIKCYPMSHQVHVMKSRPLTRLPRSHLLVLLLSSSRLLHHRPEQITFPLSTTNRLSPPFHLPERC